MFYNTHWNFFASSTCVTMEQRLVTEPRLASDHAYNTKCKQLNLMDKQVGSNSWEIVRDRDTLRTMAMANGEDKLHNWNQPITYSLIKRRVWGGKQWSEVATLGYGCLLCKNVVGHGWCVRRNVARHGWRVRRTIVVSFLHWLGPPTIFHFYNSRACHHWCNKKVKGLKK
jgi:hypothetical protein